VVEKKPGNLEVTQENYLGLSEWRWAYGKGGETTLGCLIEMRMWLRRGGGGGNIAMLMNIIVHLDVNNCEHVSRLTESRFKRQTSAPIPRLP
jgi:hypothetical protein